MGEARERERENREGGYLYDPDAAALCLLDLKSEAGGAALQLHEPQRDLGQPGWGAV